MRSVNESCAVPLQNKLMKGFSNQLIEKHRYLKYYLEECEVTPQESLEKVKSELDKLINMQQFLTVTGLQSATSKVRLFTYIGVCVLYLTWASCPGVVVEEDPRGVGEKIMSPPKVAADHNPGYLQDIKR